MKNRAYRLSSCFCFFWKQERIQIAALRIMIRLCTLQRDRIWLPQLNGQWTRTLILQRDMQKDELHGE